MEKETNRTTKKWSCCQKDYSSIYWTANSTTNKLLKTTMNSLIRSKAYRFMDSKVYVIIFQKLPRQLLSMTSQLSTSWIWNLDLQKRIAMAHDMDINVDNTMNVLLGKRHIWK